MIEIFSSFLFNNIKIIIGLLTFRIIRAFAKHFFFKFLCTYINTFHGLQQEENVYGISPYVLYMYFQAKLYQVNIFGLEIYP